MYNVISLHWESNPGSSVYKTDAVPLSHGCIRLDFNAISLDSSTIGCFLLYWYS